MSALPKPRGKNSAPPRGEYAAPGGKDRLKPPREKRDVDVRALRVPSDIFEVAPAILRVHWEDIQADWEKIYQVAGHVQIDITDGVFAGDGTFRDVVRFKQLPSSEKIELHMMVHTPANFVDAIIDLNPARCIFHLESFAGTDDIRMTYETLRSRTTAGLALALNPESPNDRLEEYMELIDYVMFMGYNPGWAGQEIKPEVYVKIAQWRERHPDMAIAVDGGVGKDSIGHYAKAGARILCANTAIFGEGNPVENYEQLQLLAKAGV